MTFLPARGEEEFIMSIDIATIKEWAEAAKTAAETLVAIVTATKALTAIIRAKRKPRARKRRKAGR